MAYSDLLIWQYQGKPKALATIKAIEDEFAQSFVDLYRLQDVLNINTATGDQLDLVGKHVGQSRIVNGYTLRQFFGFKNAENALGFSKELSGGGQWYRLRDPLADSVKLSDEDYRFLIKSRVIKNYQLGTVPDVIEACRFIFGDGCTVKDNLNMTSTVQVPRNKLTQFSKFAVQHLDIIPRQAGTKIIFEIK